MKEIVLELIKAMEAKKTAENIDPGHVTGMDLKQVIKVSLTELYREGRIKYGKTLNDYYVMATVPTEDNQDPNPQ